MNLPVIEVGSLPSSVEMVDLSQDLTIDNMEDMRILEKHQDTTKPLPGLKITQEGGLVISTAARRKILEMALGQSVSNFYRTFSYVF